jgi:hypothetical protein
VKLKTAQPILDPAVEEIDPIRVAPISVEMPVHQIAKRGAEEIRILKRERGGRIEAQWTVDYSAAVGRPGQLAYRLDTWVIKRRLSELRRPFPRLVRIGDLREIARELKHGGDTNTVRQAFEQNAATFIRAKVAYRTADGREETLEGYFNRYNVFYRGHQLPGGRRAETVYISLNDPYYGMVRSAVVRPLDFAYMRRLTPAAQRFYELLSPRLFATIKYGHESAWIRYSDYCQYAVQKRQGTRRRMQIQMAAVQRMHLRSEYIESVGYENAPADDGGPDWVLRYRPGRRARAEYRWFNEKRPPRPAAIRQPTRSTSKEDRTASLVRNDVAEVPAPDNVAARALARRFAEQRRGGTPAADPSNRQIGWAQSILDALGGDREAAEVAIDLAAKDGRRNPKGFPAHLSGVLEGGYVERALQQREQKRESAERRAAEASERDRRERHEQWCRDRAASRVAELDDASRRHIVDDRLPAYCHRYRYYLQVRPWSRDEVRVWAEPRILEEYGREGEPSFDEWCRQAQPPALH